MSGPNAGFLHYVWWVEGEWLWVRHDCNGTIVEWHPPSPTWTVSGQDVTPSFSCERCGSHSILSDCDRIEVPT